VPGNPSVQQQGTRDAHVRGESVRVPVRVAGLDADDRKGQQSRILRARDPTYDDLIEGRRQPETERIADR